MRVINTYDEILSLIKNTDGRFSKDLWVKYAEDIAHGLSGKCLDDIKAYDFSRDVLPVIENAVRNKDKMKEAQDSFICATRGLEERFTQIFSTDLPVDIILYLGLCNGAGWATALNGKPMVLLGIEKLVELDWCDKVKMQTLIYHELGHIWHSQVNASRVNALSASEKSIWQLYQEGIAMYCEQKLTGDFSFYRQNRNDWLSWCDSNKEELFAEFKRRIDTNESTQDFFGDWNNYKGFTDVGYYLGCELIKSIADKYTLIEMANMDMSAVYSEISRHTV